MIFGLRDVKTELGTFSSEKCTACKKSFSYRFTKITRYIVVLFMNVIPVGSHYQAVCESCGDMMAVDGKTGARIARKHFGARHRTQTLKDVFKMIALAAVIAAAVVLPLTIRIPLDTRPETLKSLVTQAGLYNIQDADGQVLAVVEHTGNSSRLKFYDAVSVLTGEPGANGRFKKHEYRQEATNDTEQDDLFLVRIPENPGLLQDDNGIPVRVYHYDAENDAMGYSRGIQDLSAICYEPGKVTCPFVYYAGGQEQPTPYYLVLYTTNGKQLEATFIPELAAGETNQFVMLMVKDMQDGRVAAETVYHFDAETIAAAKQAGLTQHSTAQDILSFLEKNAPEPYMVSDYEYHKDTKVIAAMTLTMQDEAGTTQSVTQRFNITEKKGYYLVEAVPEELPN